MSSIDPEPMEELVAAPPPRPTTPPLCAEGLSGF